MRCIKDGADTIAVVAGGNSNLNESGTTPPAHGKVPDSFAIFVRYLFTKGKTDEKRINQGSSVDDHICFNAGNIR